MPYLNMRAYVAKGHIGPAYNGEAIVCRAYVAKGHIGPAYNGEAIVCSRHGRSPCRREAILMYEVHQVAEPRRRSLLLRKIT